MPITGRAGTEPRSTDRNYTAGPVRCIGWLCRTAEPLGARLVAGAEALETASPQDAE